MIEQGGNKLGATLVTIAALALLVVVASRVASVIFLFFIAVLLSVYLSAATEHVVRATHLPWGLSLIISLTLSLLLLTATGAVILPPVITQFRELLAESPTYLARLDGVLQGLVERYPFLENVALGGGEEGRGLIAEVIVDGESYLRKSLVPYLTFGGKVAVEFFAVLAMGVYLAADPKRYAEGAISLFPPGRRSLVRIIVDDLANTMRAWIGAQLLAMIVLALMTVVGLWILRVPYALAFGVFTGVAAIVPFFGTATSTALPALFVLATGGVVHSLLVGLLGVVVHLVEANVVAPLIFQQQIRVPPVLTILSILLMASLLGVLGLVVAVPLLAATLVVVRHILLGEVYGDEDVPEGTAAVLVPTSEVSSLGMISREGPA